MLDTNVVVSALVWGGTPHLLIEAAVRGEVELVTSPALIAELRGVLKREHLLSRLSARNDDALRAVDLYEDLCISVSPLTTPRIVVADRDDDHVIAAAVSGSASLLVSGDRHLLNIDMHDRVEMVTVAEAVRRARGIAFESKPA